MNQDGKCMVSENTAQAKLGGILLTELPFPFCSSRNRSVLNSTVGFLV